MSEALADYECKQKPPLLSGLEGEARTAAEENLRRYLELAIEIVRASDPVSDDLTQSKSEATVPEGLVDPSTSTKTG
jgi:hypothetical protein